MADEQQNHPNAPGSKPMKLWGGNSEIFSGIIIQMLGIGEETGQVDEMLARVADYFDEELDHRISMLHTSIEPILLTVIFGTVLFIILAIYLPAFDVVNFAKKG